MDKTTERFKFAFTFWKRMVGVHFRSQLSYRVSFLFDFFSMVMVALLEFLAFALVLPKFDTIGGWTLGEVALLIGMMNMAFGLMDMIFAGFDPGFFGNQIRLGRFDQLLLRPVNITLQVLTLDFMLRRLGRVFVGIGILAYAITLTPIDWTASKLLVLACAVLGQIGFFGALFIIGATITFWTVDSIEIVNIFTYGGSEMISYPMHIYPAYLRRFFTFVLPAIFLNYYPAMYILEKPDPLGMPAFAHWLAPLVGIFLLLAARQVWHFGIRHYQSTGT